MDFSNWILLNNTLTPKFLDLWYMINAVEGNDSFPNLYGVATLYLLNILSITSSNYVIWGYIFTLSTLISFGLLTTLFYLHKKNYLFVLFLFVSPPIWLLIERNNLDFLMFLLITASAIIAYLGMPIVSLIPLSISVLLKYFTLPAMGYAFFQRSSPKVQIQTIVIVILILTLALRDFFSSSDIIEQQGESRFSLSYYQSYGLAVIGWQMNEVFSINVIDQGIPYGFFGLSILIFCIVMILILVKLNIIQPEVFFDLNQKSIWYPLFIMSSLAVIPMFLIGTRYDYGMVFLIISGMSLVALTKQNTTSLKVFKFSLFLTVWSCNFPIINNSTILRHSVILSDAIINIVIAVLIIVLTKTFYEINLKKIFVN